MILAFLVYMILYPVTHEIEVLRKQYLKAATNKTEVKDLADMCDTLSDHTDPIIHGYCSMVYFLYAKHGFNPYQKLSNFNKGKVILDSLITKHNQHVELRYLRHSIQYRVPGFLGYNGDLESDKKFMTEGIETVADSSTYHLIDDYLKKLK